MSAASYKAFSLERIDKTTTLKHVKVLKRNGGHEDDFFYFRYISDDQVLSPDIVFFIFSYLKMFYRDEMTASEVKEEANKAIRERGNTLQNMARYIYFRNCSDNQVLLPDTKFFNVLSC